MRRAVVAVVGLATALATFSAGGTATTAAAAGQASADNHAAIVVDTGDGKVREYCLAFPEAEISAIEALQRIDVRPSAFADYGSMGSGVCMLCGVGCESDNCFCNPQKFWAYHRAGPGEDRYTMSRAGASQTRVRNGDVEAWRWGGGEAPVKRSVSEICNIEEPQPRVAGEAAATTTPSTTTTTSTTPAATTASSAPRSTTTAVPAPAARSAPRSTTTSTPAAEGPAAPPATATATSEPASTAADAEDAAPARAARGADGDDITPADVAAGAAFLALLATLLTWRFRLRRANQAR